MQFCNTTEMALPANACVPRCADGYRAYGPGPVATCDEPFGAFHLSGCEEVPKCSAPDDEEVLEAFNLSTCDTSSGPLSEAECQLLCNSPDYAGTPIPRCAVDGGTFAFEGCAMTCMPPDDTAGYNIEFCAGRRTSTQCSVSCALGYTGFSVTDVCSSPGGQHEFDGCTALPRCMLGAESTYDGYMVNDCGDSDALVSVQSCSATCADGYTGSALPSCLEDGSNFTFSGCIELPRCRHPGTAGYVATGCGRVGENARSNAVQCSVQCAAGYTGSPSDTCEQNGEAFIFEGCSPIPACTAAATTGYLLTDCDDTDGPLQAADCEASCAANYGGTAVASCTSRGTIAGTMRFSGCVPLCTLPFPLTPGYLRGTCVGARAETDCDVLCNEAFNFAGTPVATCPIPGGLFTLSGCSVLPTCTLPSSVLGYNVAACNPGRTDRFGIHTSQCIVSCDPGFTGTATASCADSTFQFSGCLPREGCELPSSTAGYQTSLCATPDCGVNAIDEPTCAVDCDVGYSGVRADAICAVNGGNFELSGCYPMCVHASSTVGYDTTNCGTDFGAIRLSQCSLSCSSGYRPTGEGPAATCTSGFGVFSLTGCEAIPRCSLASLEDALAAGYRVDACSGFVTEAQCELSCLSGYLGTPSVSCASNGGEFTLSGCDPTCTLPSVTTGYSFGGDCVGSTTTSQCTVSCATFYSGDAQLFCSAVTGIYTLLGCTEDPRCTNPLTTGYITSGCGDGSTEVYPGQCTVACDTANFYVGTATAACNLDGSSFVFSGCEPLPKCRTPESSPGYELLSCNTSAGLLTAGQCGIGCVADYDGSAAVACSSDGAFFDFSGCIERCKLPADMPAGYSAVSCSGFRAPSACVMECATGYDGIVSKTCLSAGEDFRFAGCSVTHSCSLSTPHVGYDTSQCNPGRGSSYGITAAECAVRCANGFTGTAEAACLEPNGIFTLSGCTRLNTCVLPESTLGYKTHRCVTNAGVCGGNSGSQAAGETDGAYRLGWSGAALVIYVHLLSMHQGSL